ncbi:hypothetical protein CW693_03345 [Candidatus Bathyarchaeota archaeon]|nr:MAG: hypothetical protein CW693_03345 [Candidatus Bathyarchaeota archaeon]
MVKWEYKVIPIKTQIRSDHFHADRKPVIENVQNDLNALGSEVVKDGSLSVFKTLGCQMKECLL